MKLACLPACLPALPCLVLPGCCRAGGRAAARKNTNLHLMGKHVSRGQQRPWALGKTNQSNPVTGPPRRAIRGTSLLQSETFSCMPRCLFPHLLRRGSLAACRDGDILRLICFSTRCLLCISRRRFFGTSTIPAPFPPATRPRIRPSTHSHPPGKLSPSALEAGDSVSGNCRLGGNIRLTVSLSQANVPPTGRLCQCGAVCGLLVASWDRCDQRPCRGV